MPDLSADADAVETLYSSHHGWLHQWLWRKLGCRDGAADLAHDTFVRLLSAKPLDALREPRAYLSTIANGLLVNHWRRLTLERAYLEVLAQQEAALAPSPEERALTIEALMQVDAMLRKLSVKAREAFLLSQTEGLTYAVIAEQLQVSERMVKKYMAQAMLQCLLISNGDA
ncbi:sigma-70 family RNA polymerase sigma factor [Duganella dendranthematis]|jgi:RNA polymerase sigma-70 factor (ECF subfamily)|uniref:Sigma-70 family RNA polymerase sigma factor n=1 Tax=Duganella dendranthematis TaxID=2728021 RepID=A0ABX6MHB7_9BURK|nr:sigma-70 family RNA polymerase sigma factor [Duganella dendranthematis]QJD93420.1 sigma-70 family RNA polymerase sigma factor [Duganella dendranthematis]